MPTTLIAAAAIGGLGLQAYGTSKSMKASKQAFAAQQQMIAEEQAAEELRRQLMEAEARRKQTELVRSSQKARAMSLATATSQGSQFGSGLQGAYGETSGEFNTQSSAISQNLGIGENIFNTNASISQSKIGLAGAQGQAAIGQGLSSLGGAVVGAAGTFGKIGAVGAANFGGSSGFSGGSSK